MFDFNSSYVSVQYRNGVISFARVPIERQTTLILISIPCLYANFWNNLVFSRLNSWQQNTRQSSIGIEFQTARSVPAAAAAAGRWWSSNRRKLDVIKMRTAFFLHRGQHCVANGIDWVEPCSSDPWPTAMVERTAQRRSFFFYETVVNTESGKLCAKSPIAGQYCFSAMETKVYTLSYPGKSSPSVSRARCWV